MICFGFCLVCLGWVFGFGVIDCLVWFGWLVFCFWVVVFILLVLWIVGGLVLVVYIW